MKIRHNPDHRPLRAAAYMDLGDQLDAIMEGFDALQKRGIPLPPKTAAWIQHCKQVKERYSKK
jgi:hypothetical protein